MQVGQISTSSSYTSPGLQRLLLVVRVVGPVRQAQLRVELAVRRPQPPLGDRRVRVERALEDDLLQVRREDAHDQKQIGVLVADETNSFAAIGPVISVSFSSGGVRKVTPSPERLVGDRAARAWRLGRQAVIRGLR